MFKKYLGITPYEYLIRFRLNRAKILLEGTSKSIAEIAEVVGFGESCCFIKLFRQHEGTTPLQHRKLWYKANQILT